MRDGKPQQRGLLIVCGECQTLAVPVNEWYDRRPPGGQFRAVFIVGHVYVILVRISDTLVV